MMPNIAETELMKGKNLSFICSMFDCFVCASFIVSSVCHWGPHNNKERYTLF